jgi:hypothetical protein
MRAALVVGINYYEHLSQLYGCVDDAHAVKQVLSTHADGSPNFTVQIFTGTGPTDKIGKDQLKDWVEKLFASESDVALLYFAGHGHIESTGGYLLTSECKRGDNGLSLGDILTYANKSKIRNRIILLDSCHSGIAGSVPVTGQDSILSEGLTIMTASTKDQYADENGTGGIFTSLLIDALGGPAANLLGEITPGSVYAHVDQSLTFLEQRPVFKTNVKSFVSLRRVQPIVTREEIQRIVEFFPKRGSEFQLDPSFEPRDEGRTSDMPPSDKGNVEKLLLIRKYNRAALLVPVGVPNLWDACMESKPIRLTAQGEHYRRLVEQNRLN